jgi:Fe-S oxidoreductase
VHDPCVYARYENMIEPPRKLLAEAGLDVGEPQNARLLTWCCGGPVEALYPAKAAALAAVRVAQLREVAADCVTMCPICLVNLRKSADGMRFRDISEYLIEASAPPPEAGCATGQSDPDPGHSGR